MVSERTSAILLCTAYLSKELGTAVKPLSAAEWSTFGAWLVSKSLLPEDLLASPADHLASWEHDTISRERLSTLLERKASLAISLDKWTKAGIWVLNRSEAAYPQSVKEKLKSLAPPVLFGIGNPQLLNHKYVGILGSRDAGESDMTVTSGVAARIVSQQYGIVSGGAAGIDDFAMMAGLQAGGECVAILGDSLLKRSTSSLLRKYIINQKLALISPYNPEAIFSVGSAMGRNKLIYCLSKFTIVVKSGVKGGTWSGAIENIARAWVPLYIVRASEAGNQQLHKLGAGWLPENFSVEELMGAKQ